MSKKRFRSFFLKSFSEKYLKEKAVLLIYLIISLSFFIQLPKEASAQSNLQKACCEKTKQGDYCVYTEKNNCDTSNDLQVNNANCEQTTFCTNVCCVDQNNGCFPNTPKSICTNQQGSRIFNDNTCQSVSGCNFGCCIVGGEYSYKTEGECKNLANDIFGGNYDFNDVFKNVNNEQECLQLSLQEQEGCCVNNNVCSFGKKTECSGEFNLGKICSSLNECSNCERNSYKGCKDGNVYWFDSCRNPENLVEICDYEQGKLCKKEGNNAFCSSLDCSTTTRYQNWDYTGVGREHGESWCIYDGPTGNFTDRPGSVHYRFSCLNGEELAESCRDFRQEICIQANYDNNKFSEAFCVRNNIYDSPIISNLSTVAVGFKFWEQSDDNKEQCNKGTTKCRVVYIKKNRFSDWECKSGCECETPKFLDDANSYCKSFGDCGFSYNILEEEGSAGLSIFWTGDKFAPMLMELSQFYKDFLKDYGIYGGMQFLSNETENIIGILYKSKTQEAYESRSKALRDSSIGLGSFAFVAFLGFPLLALAALILGIVSIVLGGGEIREKTVTIECLPWQAPLNGNNCEKCSDDPLKECTEYRCRSLGASCELINEGTDKVKCVDTNPNDVNSPKLSPLVYDTSYTAREERFGYAINEDVEPFKLFNFGVKTDEVALCKYDLNNSIKYDDMQFNFGDSFFKKEHNLSLVLDSDKEYKYYVKCTDTKGNDNKVDYLVKIKTKRGPDLTPPIVLGTSIKNGAVVSNNTNTVLLDLRLNEPGYCRYDIRDKRYDEMGNQSICDDEFSLIPSDYICTAAFTGLKKGINNYYFRCRDLNNNTYQQSYVFSLTKSTPLVISVDALSPKDLVFVNDITLAVNTLNGAENGKAICRYSESNLPYERMIDFLVTDADKHLQPQTNLRKGNYEYYVKCRDNAGNEDDEKIKFRVVLEKKGSEIVYIYKDFTDLFVILNVASSCEYDKKNFVYGNGIKMDGDNTTVHRAALEFNEYYINCQDDQGNDVKGVHVNI